MNLEDKIKLNRVTSDFFKEEYFAPRPESEKLLNTKLDARSLNVMRDWEICLSEYVGLFKENYAIEK
jgi:dTDP-4-dehydrorhamnose reductase